MIAAIAAPTRPERAPPSDTATATGAWGGLWHEWVAGLRAIRANRELRVVFGVVAISALGEGVFGTAFWVYIDEALDGGAREAGWLVSAQAVGGLVGALVIGAWAKRRSPVSLLGWGAIGLGLIDLATFNYPTFLPGVWLGLVLMAVVGIPVAAFDTGFTAAIQTEAADAYRGRVFGALGTTMALLMIVGAAIAGAATARLGAVAVLTIDSLAYVAAGTYALRTLGPGAATRIGRKQASVP